MPPPPTIIAGSPKSTVERARNISPTSPRSRRGSVAKPRRSKRVETSSPPRPETPKIMNCSRNSACNSARPTRDSISSDAPSASIPTTRAPTLTLAETLSNQFRTEEAVELYWRAFEKGKKLEEKLAVVAKLTELYLQQNRFDRLTARLKARTARGEPKAQTGICLSQAYQSSGDYGTARQELEALLATNTRDTQLIGQLASLADAEGDHVGAAKYQKQLVELTPSEDGINKLAQMYLNAGEPNEAEAVWAKEAAEDNNEARILQAIDQLSHNSKFETVLPIAEKLVRDHPKDWEALYREGVALANLDRPADAIRRFRDSRPSRKR